MIRNTRSTTDVRIRTKYGTILGLAVSGTALVLLTMGCAGSRPQAADMPLHDPAALQSVVPEDPEKAADFLAVAADGYYFSDDFDEASATSDQALEFVPGHGEALYIRALLSENERDWEAARTIYQQAETYLRTDDELIRRMQSRYAVVTRELVREEMQHAVEGPDPVLAPDALVIHSLRPSAHTRADSVLALGVTDFLTNSFSLVDELTVVDSTRRSLLEAEIVRSQHAVYDPSTRLVERKIGAGLALSGHIGVVPSAEDQAAAGFAVSDLITEQGAAGFRGTDRQLELSTSKRHLLHDVGKQVVEVCESYFGIPLDQETKDKLSRPPTGSYNAFLAYAEGLFLEQRGQYPEAYAKYRQAAQIDPEFVEARAGADRVGGAGAGGTAISLGEGLPPPLTDPEIGEEILDASTILVDEHRLDGTDEEDQTITAHTTVRIEIITHGK